jgi:hypothetical protein
LVGAKRFHSASLGVRVARLRGLGATGQSARMGAIVSRRTSAVDAKATFASLDANQDGYLTVEELTKVAKANAEIRAAWPDERIREMVAEHDLNKDGKLNRMEFEHALDSLHKVGAAAAKPKFWVSAGGGELDAALAVVSELGQAPVRLVDAAYLVKLASKKSSVLERRQDMPEHAFLSLEELKQLPKGWAGLRVLAVSHAWLHPHHPDPRGETLQLLARVLGEYIKGWGKAPAGKYGVFLDYCSICQKGAHGEERTPAEAELFRTALGSMSEWYSHPRTTVLKITKLPSGYPAGFDFPSGSTPNTATYHGRGWCYTEASVANLVKPDELVLDLGRLKADRAYHLKEVMQAATRNYVHAGRAPPLTPDAFREQLETKSFTSKKADIGLVLGLYESAFTSRLGSASSLVYSDLNWGGKEAKSLVQVISSGILAPKLKELNLFANMLDDDAAALLAEAMSADTLPQLVSLALGANQIGDAGLTALAQAGLPHVPKLRNFSVGANVADEGTAALAAAIANGALPVLEDFSFDRSRQVGDAGVTALVAALTAARTPLKTLNLELCEIGDGTLKGLAAAFSEGGLSVLAHLKLDQQNSRRFTPNGGRALAEAIEKAGVVLHIDMGVCNDEVKQMVAGALRANREALHKQSLQARRARSGRG